MRLLLKPGCLRRPCWFLLVRSREKCEKYVNWDNLSKGMSLLQSHLLLIAVIMLLLCITTLFFTLWLFTVDTCDTEMAKYKLCENYKNGLIAGSLCFDLCISETFLLPPCESSDNKILVFHTVANIMKLHQPDLHVLSSHPVTKNSPPKSISHLEGKITAEEVQLLLTWFFQKHLGPVETADLLDRVNNFADANKDGKLSFGEANSVWDLLNINEFLNLFLLQDHTFAPQINGTCGSFYVYENVPRKQLFDKYDKNFVSNFVSNKHQWGLPVWEKRVNIVIGLLEMASALLELQDTRWHLCSIEGTSFGHSITFEAKLTALEKLISDHRLKASMHEKACKRDSDCVSKAGCHTKCDITNGTCTSKLQVPMLEGFCQVIEDFLMFDAPEHIRANLSSQIRRCRVLGTREKVGVYKTNFEEQDLDVSNIVFLQDLTRLLWSQIDNKPANWLQPPKKKRKRSQN